MNNDPRAYQIRLTKGGFQTLTVPQSFFDRRPLVKTPGDEETEPVYYTADDALTFEQAMRLYAPETVALYAEQEVGAPQHHGLLEDHEILPGEMTHAVFAFAEPKLGPLEIADIVRIADSIGVPLSEVLIPWGEDFDNYREHGMLPA